MRYRSTLPDAPIGNFVAFLIMFGWEGPAALLLGIRDWNWGTIVAGVLLTAFFWGAFGLPLLTECVRRLWRRKR